MRTRPASLAAPMLSPLIAVAGVLLASIGFGLVPYFAKSLTEEGLAAHAVAFYRFLLAASLLWPLLILERRQWRAILWGVLSGALMGVGWIGYVLALGAVPVSTVGVIYMTYPVFTVLLAWGLFSERPTSRSLTAGLTIVAAAALASSPVVVAPAQLPFVLIAFAAPLGFGFGIAVLVHKLSVISAPARIASASMGAALGLAPLVLLSDASEIVPSDGEAWLLIIGIALGTALVPQMIYVVCAPVIGAARAAVLGGIELPTAFLVGLIAFGEPIGAVQALACALVLTAIFVANGWGRRAARR